jgi:hypothetical protein
MNSIEGESMEALASDALPVDSHVLPEVVATLSIGGTKLIDRKEDVIMTLLQEHLTTL